VNQSHLLILVFGISDMSVDVAISRPSLLITIVEIIYFQSRLFTREFRFAFSKNGDAFSQSALSDAMFCTSASSANVAVMTAPAPAGDALGQRIREGDNSQICCAHSHARPASYLAHNLLTSPYCRHSCAFKRPLSIINDTPLVAERRTNSQ